MLKWADRSISTKEARPQVFTATPRPLAAAPSPAPPPSPVPPPGWRPSPNYRGTKPIYRPPATPAPRAPATTAPSAPPTPAPPAAPTWRPHDPWTGMVQAWPMPWTPPYPAGAPPAYSGAWQPGARPHTGSPGLLMPRPPAHAHYAAPTYTPYAASPPPPYDPGAFYSPYHMYTAPAFPIPARPPSTTPPSRPPLTATSISPQARRPASSRSRRPRRPFTIPSLP